MKRVRTEFAGTLLGIRGAKPIPLDDPGRNVATGVAVGAAFGVSVALYRAYQQYQCGEESWQQIHSEVLREGLTGVAAGAAGAAAGTAVAAMLPAGNTAIIGGLVAGVAVAILISKVTDEQWAAFFAGCAALVAVNKTVETTASLRRMPACVEAERSSQLMR